jgi:DNA-binding Xre family transcriptional regulator
LKGSKEVTMQDGEKMFDNFAMRFPFIAEKVIEYCESSEYDITVKLEDGDIFLYDDMEGSIRRLPTDSGSLTKEECNREFGERLIRMMRRKCINQAELSERTGIAQPQISNYLNGKNTPSFYVVDKIAKALKCSTEYFRYT